MQKDLVFRTTKNRQNFQVRYVMNHPYEGALTCAEGKTCVRDMRKRLSKEARNLSKITGWSVASINKNIRRSVPRQYRKAGCFAYDALER